MTDRWDDEDRASELIKSLERPLGGGCVPLEDDVQRIACALRSAYDRGAGDAAGERESAVSPNRPVVVTLCGSTRFIEQFRASEFAETLAGKIVLTIGCDSKSDDELFRGPDAEQIKAALDELHKRKIDLSDEILVLNVGGYVGSSTRSEIEYAITHGKRVRWLEPESGR